jgi:sugar/nucleoside kinase (ribokinase family)
MAASDGRWDVIGIGENSVDSVNLLPGYPQPTGPSAKMRIRERHVLCGGQMATAMCACASLGLRAKYVGVTGTDDNGRRIRAELQGRDVDISDLVIRDVENRFAVILVDENTGDRMVLWDRDDRLRLRESELPVAALGATTVVHVDDVDDEVAIRAARLAREAGAMVTSDIAPRNCRPRSRTRSSHSTSRCTSPVSTTRNRRCARCARRSTTCWW